ncbi:Acetoin utilization deacetylase AcuC [Octadecabacter temperatus]|uniref:Acetylpolyamine aminohydrolase n=1 Tax=Octadecabacter temperatus TaxID=1458307 RepID=A0A0K0Y563_9RHOB|nr:histone deacetylase family protein [Octadecabacter temperatus]AKS46128.1 Acetylpolyamine aminohydrolase [Octadecabacter temperatus]SIO08040.1 Acetoin utilization deacetylase AcuC [Octadecabacter temperatus]
METIFTERHRLRNSKTELFGGQLVEPFERPSRAEYIIGRVREVDLGPVSEPDDYGMDPILAIHDADFIAFLQGAWSDWQSAGFEGEAMPTVWPARRMSQKIPTNIEGRLGYYALACETTISEGTWEAAYASAQVALTGAQRLNDGAKSVFSLCRPPGHHAAIDMYGGYCFVNNAAVAAQHLLDTGAKRIAILDVDFHHGNGTQDIFDARDDVLFISLHGDPMDAFPHFLGHADETGNGNGDGFTINYPMPPNTDFKTWREALQRALAQIADYAPDKLIISLGVDTFESDPISFFKLKSEDFTTYGADIATLNLPTLFVMEGGYDIAEISVNTINVLQGFESAS